ncbi:MAG: putative bifunctional diguanylate cyclase/phosphodiesterase [Burkholderiales bacterium]
MIALGAIVTATLILGHLEYGEISVESVFAVQQKNVSLWVLDAMPFAFAWWGQYVSSLMAFEASAMVIDQTSEMQARAAAFEKQAMRSATHDALTDLPNRVLLYDRLEQGLYAAWNDKRRLAILILDLDRFKEINDTLGHNNGDRVIKQVALRLRDIVREPDTLARLGGDEFAVMLREITAAEDAVAMARRIQEALQAPFMLEGMKLDIQASMGIACYPEHGADADVLLQRADVAMYVAKKNHSGLVVYSAELDRHSPQRLMLMGELRHAIERGELTLHYQPKVDIRTGMVREVEALVRWQHPSHGLMPPDQFIPLAERTGLINPLTLWVLNRSLEQCAKWRAEGLTLGVAVNLSAHTLLDQELPVIVGRTLAAHAVPPALLAIEITESTIMADAERAIQVLDRLAAMGVRLAIDDFGTGYSSLVYLSKMPVKEIKIDKSFVMDMERNSSNASIVKATIDLGHNLGLEVVAEGTENDGVLARLRALGCDTAQGYYFSRPLDAGRLAEWLGSRCRKMPLSPQEPATLRAAYDFDGCPANDGVPVRAAS